MRKVIPAIIKPHHVAKILDCSISTARRKLHQISKSLNRPARYKYVSFTEFSTYTGIPINDILRSLTS